MTFNILTTPDVRQRGIGSMQEAGEVSQRFAVEPVDSLFGKAWADDRHFVGYRLHGKDGEELAQDEQPRLRKSVRGEIEQAGGAVRCWGFVGDYDLNENVPDSVLTAAGWNGEGKRPKIAWTQELLDQFTTKLEGVVESLRARDLGPGYIYLTNHGARFVHFYSTDLDPQQHEEVTGGMIGLYAELGVVLDDACVDWTRMFRAPRVRRRVGGTDIDTGDQQWFKDWHYRNCWTIPALAPRTSRLADSYAHVSEYVGDRPSAEECLDLLVEDPATGRPTETSKNLKRLFKRKGLDLLMDILVGKIVTLPEGGRDSTLTSLTGQLAVHIYEQDWASPELMYAVLLPVLEQLEPDQGTPDWFDKCWQLCKGMWTKEMSKAKAKTLEKEQEEERNLSKLDHLLECVRRLYPKNALLQGDDHVALVELSRMGMVKSGPTIYVLRRDGYYDPQPCSTAVLPGKVIDLGMEFLMPTEIKGVLLKGSEMLMQYGREVSKVEGSAAATAGSLRDGALVVPCYQRRQIPRRFRRRVHRWLRKMLGSKWSLVCLWIGEALAFDELRPLPLLLLVGESGSGKSLIVAGMADATDARKAADGRRALRRFNAVLLGTPFIHFDEDIPRLAREDGSTTELLRSFVGGSPRRAIERKGREAETLEAHPRFVATMNSQQRALSQLLGDGDLSRDDVEAIANRVLAVDIVTGTAAWLSLQAERSSRPYTDKWLEDDSLAQHFLWCYENRDLLRARLEARGELPASSKHGRLLLPSNAHGLLRLRDADDAVPDLLVRNAAELFIGEPASQLSRGAGAAFRQGRKLFFCIKPLVEQVGSLLGPTRRERMQAIDRICVGSAPDNPWRPAPGARKARWRQLDSDLVIQVLRGRGFEDLADSLERVSETHGPRAMGGGAA